MNTEPRACDLNEDYDCEPDFKTPMPPKITKELLAKLDEYYRNQLGSNVWDRRQRLSDWRWGNSLSMEMKSFNRYDQLQEFCAALDQTISLGLICCG